MVAYALSRNGSPWTRAVGDLGVGDFVGIAISVASATASMVVLSLVARMIQCAPAQFTPATSATSDFERFGWQMTWLPPDNNLGCRILLAMWQSLFPASTLMLIRAARRSIVMLRIAFGSILLISGLSGRLALVGESASQSIALGGAMLTMFGVLSMLAKRAKAESAAESVKTLSGA